MSQTTDGPVESEPAYVLIGDPDNPDMVPDVVVDDGTVNINGTIVTFTLSWGEPFNYLDPIVNYTVSCSGDVTCPANFITTDNTTRSYTITNLTSMTTYTFSVVATNSIGSGEAGVVMFTTPPAIEQVTGVVLMCKPADLTNQCTVMWNAITRGDITEYQVYYNGTMMNVNSSTTALTFTASSLPDGVFMATIIVTVTATNRYGIGPAGYSEPAIIAASSVMSVTYSISVEQQRITLICYMVPESTADQCVVTAMDDEGGNITGTAAVMGTTATVILTNISCSAVEYTIIAGGTLNGNLVGPRSSHGMLFFEECPQVQEATTDDNGGCEERRLCSWDYSWDNGGCVAGITVGIIIAGISDLTITLVVIVYVRYKKGKVPKTEEIVEQPLQKIVTQLDCDEDETSQPKARSNYADLAVMNGPEIIRSKMDENYDQYHVQYATVHVKQSLF